MGQSYCNLLYHMVFGTKHIRPFLTDPDIRRRLHAYLGGIVREMNGIALCIGGTEDHVHIYAKMHQDFSVSTMLRTIKSKSSGWVHRTIPELGEFQWQNGYACFTVSQSGEAKLACYIQRQEIHHHARSFRDELIALLKAHRVEFREAFLQ